MAYTDDYNVFADCNATTDWTAGGTAAGFGTSTTRQEGTNSLIVKSSAGSNSIATYSYAPTAGLGFKLIENDAHFWFLYAKGKSPPYLSSNNTAVVARCYLSATDWADFYLTDTGDDELQNGWNIFQWSGTEQNGGGKSSAWTNWDRTLTRIEMRFEFANDNNGGSDPDLLMDCFFYGSTITVSEGTPSVPINFASIQTFSDGSNAHNGNTFPLGLVTVIDKFANLKCGIQVGNGSDGTNNEGNIKDTNKQVLFNQASEEVKHDFIIKNFSSVILGDKETGTDGTYYVRGCQVTLPASRYSTISVENGGILRAFNSKFYRWGDIFLGAASDTGSTIELGNVDFDANETVYFRANTLDVDNVEIHDNADLVRNQAAEIIVSPDSCSNLLIYECDEAIHIRETITITELFCQDNTTYDIAVLEGKTATVKNGIFLNNKIARLAS